MAALRLSRQRISKLNIKEININLGSKRPRAIAATRYAQVIEDLANIILKS